MSDGALMDDTDSTKNGLFAPIAVREHFRTLDPFPNR